jgi:hypothetical protein
MATKEATTQGEKGLKSIFSITEDRRTVGLNAAWEIEALGNSVRDLCSGIGDGDQRQDDLMQLELQMRGVTARIQQLSCVLMSVLDDEDDTRSLEREVFGARYVREQEKSGARDTTEAHHG